MDVAAAVPWPLALAVLGEQQGAPQAVVLAALRALSQVAAQLAEARVSQLVVVQAGPAALGPVLTTWDLLAATP